MKPEHKAYILKHADTKSAKQISEDLKLRERNVLRFLASKGIKPSGPAKVSIAKNESVFASEGKMRTHIFFMAAIFVLVLTVYFNALQNSFIWDDRFLIVHNVHIKNFRHLFDIFKTYLASSSINMNNFYRPMQELSYMVDYALWGYKPFGFHLTNIMLHGFCAIGVYLLSLRILKNSLGAFIAGALFGIHPVNTEAVTYIAGRADPLFLLFFLLSFLMFLKSVESLNGKNRLPVGFYALSIFFYVLSILSKEIGLILPVFLLLYLRTFYPDRGVRFKPFLTVTPFVAIIPLFVLVRTIILSSSQIAAPFLATKFGLYERLLMASKAFCVYLYLFIAPFKLHMERSIRYAGSLSQPEAMGAVVVVAAFVLLVWQAKKYSKKIFFGGMWFLIGFLPVSNIVPINSFIAEHWLYLPSIGIYMMIGLGAANIFYRNFIFPVSFGVKITVLVLFAAVSAYFGLLTFERNKDWKDEITFFENTLQYSPNNARLYLNLGNAYSDRRQAQEAIQAYHKTIELEPKYTEAYYALAQTNFGLQNFAEAEKYVKEALALEPNQPSCLQLLALIEQQKGNYPEAEKLYWAALKVIPHYVKCRINLGLLYLVSGQKDKAVSQWQKVLEIDPGNAEAGQYLVMSEKIRPGDKPVIEYH